jgi:shikimate dehydrogenase
MNRPISGRTLVAGVTGHPVRHSLSPLIHNAWLSASGMDGVYVAFEPGESRFGSFVTGLRGGVIQGLNVTAPFKAAALQLADTRSVRAERAGSANLLIFNGDGSIHADNTDGEGLLWAFRQAVADFDASVGPVVVLGAGGAARGAVAGFLDAGAPSVRVVNRSMERASALVSQLGAGVMALDPTRMAEALDGAAVVINATPQGLHGEEGPDLPFKLMRPGCLVMDMVYRPLRTEFLRNAESFGFRTVDGLGMLIGQAIPSFQALFGAPPPSIEVRSLALAALGDSQ